MKIKIALSLIALAFLPACQHHENRDPIPTHETTRFAKNAADQEPAPPAEGPADVNCQPGLHSNAVAAQFRRGQPLADQRSAGAAALRRLIASPNESICASECAALTVTRRRAAPFATVG